MNKIYKGFLSLIIVTSSVYGAQQNESSSIKKMPLVSGITKILAASTCVAPFAIGSFGGLSIVFDEENNTTKFVASGLVGSSFCALSAAWLNGKDDLKKAFKKSSTPYVYGFMTAAATITGLGLGFGCIRLICE